MIQIDKATLLSRLHVKGNPLILFNIWDAGSAKSIQEIGAKVIATSSWSVATAHGYLDGEELPFSLVLANLKRIIASVELPVTIDLEGGYSKDSALLEKNVIKIIEEGAVGINFEDQIVGEEGLYSIEEQCKKIKAIRRAADSTSVPIFINARTDVFFKKDSLNSNDSLKEAINRALAYADSGADGFFVPGLMDVKYIEKLCTISPIPINIMIQATTPSLKQLAELGVARISYGPGPYCQAMAALQEDGRKVFSIL